MNNMQNDKVIASNRQVLRDYTIEKSYEAGIELFGSEVKSIRAGKVNLKGSFARVDEGQVYVFNMHINPYEYSRDEIDAVRKRRLLLHKKEIHQIFGKLTQKGYTLLPLKIYYKKRYVKIEIGLGKGKREYDKRHAIKEKQALREIKKGMAVEKGR
ncbi:MAG: SsrA-binding protein SmpB [Candidatus Omnitrophica bacterium]|nr:SsrA-binding protein SmpB [Candidatus Omnitrophota bacterium]